MYLFERPLLAACFFLTFSLADPFLPTTSQSNFAKRDSISNIPCPGQNWSSSDYTTAQNATVFALIYGAPLPSVVNFSLPILANLGANSIYNTNATADPSESAVVRPNVDTVYSVAITDLSHNDVAITIPPITDGRFYVVPFYDMYGNNYANIGSVNSNKPGTYLLRRVQDVGVPYGLNTTNPPPGYAGIINSPTTYGFILIRILLLNRGSDIDMVKAYQIAFNTELVERNYTSPPQPPALTVGLLAQGLSGSNEEKVLQLTARLAPYNPPEEVEMIGNVTRILELAGLKNGTYTQPADTNLTDATAVARLSVRAELMKPYLQQNFGNNWHQLIPEVSGNFGSDFAVRAYIAETALAQLTTEQALYPTFSPPNATDELLNVGADEAVMFTFSGKPPVVGFWSLTIYGEDFYLIPNEVGVYSLGDRSNITFADGAKIYSGGGVWNSTGDIRDGQFQILVQPANVVPPGNWTGNWLPAPSGGGKFLVNLRWYGPTGGLSDGKYVYPVVSTLTAMRA